MSKKIPFSMLESMSFEGECYSKIPDYMQDSILNYIVNGIRPGKFLEALICNNLFNTFAFADSVNIKLIDVYIKWFHNYCPGNLVGEENFLNHISNP